MGKFLFGSAPSSQMMQTPGGQAADQFFQSQASQEGYGFKPDEELYNRRFADILEKGKEGAKGSFADLGFGGGRHGVLGSALTGLERDVGLAKESAISGRQEEHKRQILGGLGRAGGTAVTQPGSPGLIGNIASALG